MSDRILKNTRYFDFDKIEPKWDAIMEDANYINYCRVLSDGTVWLSVAGNLDVVDMYFLRDSIGVIDNYDGGELLFEAPWLSVLQSLAACQAIDLTIRNMIKEDEKQEGYIRAYGEWAEALYDTLMHSERVSDHDLLDMVRERIDESEGKAGVEFLSGLLEDSRIAESRLEELAEGQRHMESEKFLPGLLKKAGSILRLLLGGDK